jgi:D-alanyl-D-alanine-carboxypeptidase/D-alanyl-D-alanine-endopeptidase
VKLDAPAQTYAPGGLVLPKRNGKEIALVHLSEQNSGLPRLPGNMQPANMANPYADYTVAQLHVFLSNYQLQRDPGEKFEYSNLGVGLLGHLLATRIGKSYEALVTERILKRLGMTSTAITLSPAMQANLVKGHDRSGNVVSNWDMPALAGAGALRSSMTDMLTFLDANLGEPKNDLERAMRLAQQPRAVADNMQIGLNWLTIPTPSGKVVAHDGGTGGYGAFIAMDPGRGIGVVVLANTAARTSSDIALHLLDPAAPLAPKPVAAEPKQRVAVDVPVEVLQRYVGEYVLDSISFTMKLTVEDGALVIHPQGQGSDRLFAESPTQFFSRTIDAQITMLTDASGAATGFTLHQSGANLPARKVR